MADSIKWRLSLEPIEELTDDGGGTHSVIHSDVGRSIGAGGVVSVDDMKYIESYEITQGAYGDPEYIPFNGDAGALEIVFIKNLGVDGNGDVSAGVICISIDQVADNILNQTGDEEDFCRLEAGEAILLRPRYDGALIEAQDLRLWRKTADVCVEILADAP
jgi:hypothetical protein